MLQGTTTTGFAFELEEEVLDDYELLEALRSLDKGDGQCVIDVVDRLLGEKQKEKLKDHIRNEKGRVSVKRLMDEVAEIFHACNAGKN